MPSHPDSATESPLDLARFDAVPEPSSFFQIGDGHLLLSSADPALLDRFRRLYGDCETDSSSARGVRVDCVVSRASGEVIVDTRDAEAVDAAHFIETVFADRGIRPVSTAAGGWRTLESLNPPMTFRTLDRRVVFDAGSPWQAMAANLGVGLVIRLQHDTIFLHAAGVALKDGPGVLFVGPKAAGKTTTALGLASRGHALFGDEIIGVQQNTLDLVPVRRTISKREGPCAEAIDGMLATTPSWTMRYPGGETRTVVPASRLFGTLATTARLGAIVFLDGFETTPQLTPLEASFDTVSRLTPVTSTLWEQSNAARAFALVRLLSSVACYTLRLGPPDETSSLLETRFAR